MTRDASTSTSSPAQRWLVIGQQALAAGKRSEGVSALRQAVSLDPYHVESLLWLAGVCGNPHESLRLLTRVLALDPQNPAAHEGIRWARKRLSEREANTPTPSIPLETSTPPSPDAPIYLQGRVRKLENDETSPSHIEQTRPAVRVPARMPMPPLPPGAPVVATGARRRKRSWRRTLFWVTAALALCLCTSILLSAGIVWLLQSPIDYNHVAQPIMTAAEPEDDEVADPPEPSTAKIAVPLQPTPTYAERAEKILREVDTLWAKGDWALAAPLIAQAVAFSPGDQGLRRKLMSAYFKLAVSLLDDGELERALDAFDQALEVLPGDPQAQVERDTLANYLAGLTQFNQGNWLVAAELFKKVYSAYAGYLDTRGLLYRTYFQHALELKEKKDWEGALKVLQLAVDIDADAIEARGELALVKAALVPPAPKPPGANGEKWIDINLTTQRFRAYQGQTLQYEFVTSTGEPARPTQAGRYEVLDKIPNAYSRFWNLQMPYWLGIYWAGSSENGIHALPILSNGQTLWAGYLGRRVSFGCVILDTKAAKLIYDWAEIGTPVVIHY